MRTSPTTLVAPAGLNGQAPTLVDVLDLRRIEFVSRVVSDPGRQSELGQFFTPAPVARFMAAMLSSELPTRVRILDPGAGTGVLAAAAVAELCARPEKDRPEAIHVTAWELDVDVEPELRVSLDLCRTVAEAAGIAFTADARAGDFILEVAEGLAGGLFTDRPPPFDVAILNPPYRKLRSDTPERERLSAAGIETSNLYAAFVWLALRLLRDGGEMVAITPRSFMNGSYFRPFRAVLRQSFGFRRVHVYESRSAAFVEDEVLQENVIFHGIKGAPAAPVQVTTSHGPMDPATTGRLADPDEVVRPDDPDHVFHVVPDENDAAINAWTMNLPFTLADLGVLVSTGRVVGFRARERLRGMPGSEDAPMIFPSHFREGFVEWPDPNGRKPNGLAVEGETDPLLMPHGWYVLVKRFSAKEERRRVVAALWDPERLEASPIAFDNKLNVLHRDGRGLPASLAKGVAVFLNSTAVDLYFRQFSGHTQVNARDLRSLRFPDIETLERLGSHVGESVPSEREIDELVREELPMTVGGDPIAAKRKIEEAVRALADLNTPVAQRNKRSALTLLALLDLGPAPAWEEASDPLRGVTEIMDWMADNYGTTYAPNTRETIRRFTLHQFMEMGLVLFNPDHPRRPTNSPNNCYQIDPAALDLLRTFGSSAWKEGLEEYLTSVAGRNRLRQEARRMQRIAVTLPDGETLKLSPGGQNVLVREIVQEFAPRFTPGGHVVHVGDTAQKHLLYDQEYLQALGVEIAVHGKMPDVVVHYAERDWLVLIEAVTSHGPVNLLRHNQLKQLFVGSRAGLVFVTAFLDRAAMRTYLPEIAWETEVWVADAPGHLIHFNGERFLGPHGVPRPDL